MRIPPSIRFVLASTRLAVVGCVWAACCLAAILGAQAQPLGAPPGAPAPPDSVRPWAALLGDQLDQWSCARPASGEGGPLCTWPGWLDLRLVPEGARFFLVVNRDIPGWVFLPGGAKPWPTEAKVGGEPAVVSLDPERSWPRVWLPAGESTIEGLLPFERVPDYVQISKNVGLVTMQSAEGQRVTTRIDDAGRVWLREGAESSAEGATSDALRVSIYRRLQDDVPLRVTTRLDLSVSGRAREVNLGPLLLSGSRPVAVRSPLPVRVDGLSLRAFVRPGTHTIEVDAIFDEHPESLVTPAHALEGIDAQEIWVWYPNETLRSVEVEGLVAVDPSSTSLPAAWRGDSTLAAKPGDQLVLRTSRRGEPEPPPNRIELARELWLDIDGDGYTVHDDLSGVINRDWRLNYAHGTLGRVTDHSEGLDLLITTDSGEQAGQTGVELRTALLNLSAESRLDGALESWPAVGWATDVQSLSARLHLPPGWTFVAASGVDEASHTWVGSWTLFDVFVVLVFGLAAGRLFGVAWGVVAALAFTLAHGQYDAPSEVWFALLATSALLRAVPRVHWTWRWFTAAHVAACAILVMALFPYLVGEMRTALYPAVESAYPYGGHDDFGVFEAPTLTSRAEKAAEMVDSLAYEDVPLVQEQSKSNIGSFRSKKMAVDNRMALANLQQLDPQSVVQTGPGLPTWEWSAAQLVWNGPVAADQQVHIWVLSPFWTGLLGVLRLLLFLALAAVVMAPRRLSGKGDGSDLSVWLRRWTTRGAAGAMGVFLLGASGPNPAHAQTADSVQTPPLPVPSPAPKAVAPEAKPQASPIAWQADPASYLQAWKTEAERLAGCRGPCAQVTSLNMSVDTDGRWRIEMEVHAVRDAAVALPGPLEVLRVDRVSVTTAQGLATPLRRTDSGMLAVRVPEGIQRIEAFGTLPGGDSVAFQIPADSAPRRMRVEADGWTVDGIERDGTPGSSVQLTRGQTEGQDATTMTEAGGELMPWYTVRRRLLLGLPWTVRTRVERGDPSGARIVKIPLLAGEAVTTEGVRVEDGFALATFATGESEVSFESDLPVRPQIALQAPKGAPWSEVWEVECGTIWQCRHQGIVPVSTAADGLNVYTWRPWPGEAVDIAIERPAGAPGAMTTITKVDYRVTPSERLLQGSLSLVLRASQGTRHSMTLPEGAELQQVLIDGQPRAIRPDGRRLDLPVRPGEQRFELEWHQPREGGLVISAPVVDLGGEAVNASVIIEPGADRFVIGASGPSWGPAILFWSHLGSLLLLGLLLSFIRGMHVRRTDWLLLALGFGQLPPEALIPVVVWFGLLAWRQQIPRRYPIRFNLLQLTIAGATLALLGVLYAAVGSNLLGAIDMRIRGMGSSSQQLMWYADRLEGLTPEAKIVSVPGLVWRGAMLVWSLWLLSALIRWLRYGWSVFRVGGLVEKRPPKRKAPPRTPPTPESAASP